MKKSHKPGFRKTSVQRVPVAPPRAAWGHYVLLALGMLFIAYVRFRYLQLPLERDEGEFGTIAQRILHGLSPFEAYNYKLPGVPFLYAAFMLILGQTIPTIHIALLCANLGTSMVLYVAAKRFLGGWWAAVAAIVYGLMSLDYTVLGTAAHATQFVNFFMVSGIFFLQRKRLSLWNSLIAGLMMGLSFTMKQPAFLFILFGALLLGLALVRHRPSKRSRLLGHLSSYAVGAAAPFLAIVLLAVAHHQFALFWKWNFTYPRIYISVLTLGHGWENFKVVFGEMVGRFLLLWLMAGFGLITLILDKEKERTFRIAIPLLALFSMLAILPGYYFHHHYFIMLLPAAALCAGNAFGHIQRWMARWSDGSSVILIMVFIAIAGAGIVSQKDFYFNYSLDQYSRVCYLHNPFREAIPVANYIDSITSPEDKILVVGSEAEIYFYSRRAAASGYLFVHALVSNQPKNLEMQNEFMAEAEKNRPEMMVLCGVEYSWLKQPGAPDTILQWFDKYSAAHYEIVGIVDMLDQGTIYKWGEEAKEFIPQAANYLVLYKRKA